MSEPITSLPTAGTIDAIVDTFPIVTNSINTTQQINRNVFLSLSSQPVGISDSQTLTNKTITSPTISGPTLSGTIIGTYTIGGTPTFPTSVVTLTGSQTLTNKILTSPTINSPTITNATISADTIIGFSTSTIGTVYGLGINNGAITPTTVTASGLITASSGFTLSSGTLTLPNNSISAAMLATAAITLGYTQITGNFTTTSGTAVQVTGLTTTVTIPAGGRKVRITGYCGQAFDTGANGGESISIWDGTVGSGVQLNAAATFSSSRTANTSAPLIVSAIVTPSAGSKTYNIGFSEVGGVGTATFQASATQPGYILVEVI